ncbi:MAG: hypothetical protein H0T44_04155 [Gemmatimonadales bacterium]|nr:hypothetical protein [Gemmatimonadales bacterium]
MLRRLLVALGLAASGVLLPVPLAGQTSPYIPAAFPPLPAPWAATIPPAPLVRPVRSGLLLDVRMARQRGNHTLVGLAIGAGLVTGYAFYNTICEAVDNRCSNSRVPHLMIGAGLGGDWARLSAAWLTELACKARRTTATGASANGSSAKIEVALTASRL